MNITDNMCEELEGGNYMKSVCKTRIDCPVCGKKESMIIDESINRTDKKKPLLYSISQNCNSCGYYFYEEEYNYDNEETK